MDINIKSEAELAKSTITNSNLDEDAKRNLILLINASLATTNGITHEEKIQKMTESIAMLIMTLGVNICKNDSRITCLEKKIEEEYPTDHLTRMRKLDKQLQDVEKFRSIEGIPASFNEAYTIKNAVLKNVFDILKRPFAWISISVIFCSPYAT